MTEPEVVEISDIGSLFYCKNAIGENSGILMVVRAGDPYLICKNCGNPPDEHIKA